MHFKTLLMIVAASSLLLAAAPGHGLGSGPAQAVATLGGPLSPGATLGTSALSVALPLAGLAAAAVPTEPAGHVGPAAVVPAGAAGPVAAEMAAQAPDEQIAALEQQVAQLLAEAQRQRLQLSLISERLASAESANHWLPLLGLGLAVAATLAVLLALRLLRMRRKQVRQSQWAAADQADWQSGPRPATASSASAPLFSTEQPLLAGRQTASESTIAAASSSASKFSKPMAEVTTTGAAGPAATAYSFGSGVPPRPVSVEELLDLDQQVDFFMVLGQEQAAIDLLLSHVRATGGTSALPYFRLLQIYRQQGDEEAYERTRDRFNQRFNAQAPDWHGDLAAGRCLEQYPEVVARLQRAWPQPLRAVAELESLLLRRADLEPFDLPAFHDILTLHALVRDMPALPVTSEAAAVAAAPAVAMTTTAATAAAALAAQAYNPGIDTVDLLLPLGDGPNVITQPRPHLSDSGTTARAMLADWVFSRAAARLPTPGSEPAPEFSPSSPVRLDLDLSDFAPAPREFTRPAAFTDVDLRRDSRLSDLAGFDDSDMLPPSISRS